MNESYYKWLRKILITIGLLVALFYFHITVKRVFDKIFVKYKMVVVFQKSSKNVFLKKVGKVIFNFFLNVHLTPLMPNIILPVPLLFYNCNAMNIVIKLYKNFI